MPVGDGATFRFIVEDALSGGKGGGGKGGSDESPDNPDPNKPEQQVQQVKNQAKAVKGGMLASFKALGIQLSLANLLKQSQIFTGIISSVFQVLGAVLDVALAPLLPYFAKFLKDYFPKLLGFSERIANFLSGELAKFEELGLGGYIADVFTRLGDSMIDFIPNLLSSIASVIRSWFGEEAGKNIDEFTGKIKTAFKNLGEWIDNWLPGPAIFNTSDGSGDEGGSGGPSEKTSFGGVGKMIKGVLTGVDNTIDGVKKAVSKTGIFGKVAAGLGKVATTTIKTAVPLSGTAMNLGKFGKGVLKKAAAPLGVVLDALEVNQVIQEHGFAKGMQLLGIKAGSYAAGAAVGAGITAVTGGVGAPVGLVAGGATSVVTEKLLRRITGFDASLEVKVDTGGPTENTMMVANDKQKNQIAATIHSDSSMYTGGM